MMMNYGLKPLFWEIMKNRSFVCLLFLMSIILCNCYAEEKEYAETVVTTLKKNDVNLTEYSHVVVIPNVGCGGCISEAEHFFRENKAQDILFVFTKISSEKSLRLRLGNMINQKNVLIDSECIYASQKEEINVYPVIIDIRNENKYTWCFLDPGVSYETILTY